MESLSEIKKTPDGQATRCEVCAQRDCGRADRSVDDGGCLVRRLLYKGGSTVSNRYRGVKRFRFISADQIRGGIAKATVSV